MTSPTNDTLDQNFTQFELLPQIVDRLEELDYKTPTPIQKEVIPCVLNGQDVIAGANTGSGKTAAFALPLLQKISKLPRANSDNFVSALILVPTRELATQIANNIISYSSHFNGAIKVSAVFGGVSTNKQMQNLKGGTDILVATPGRLLDLISSNTIKLEQTTTLVLDEADRLLSLGFTEEISSILKLLPKDKQTLLFSATFPDQVKNLTQSLLNNPVEFQLQSKEESTLVQRVFTVNKGEKTAVVAHLIKQHNWKQTLIFVNSKNGCNHLADKLLKRGITSQVFHGDKAQSTRTQLLSGFKSGEIDVLIATDIAARGLDIEKLPVVINFDLPRSPADYMHRIGRSGRAGEVGLGLSLIDHEDYHHFKIIEKKNKFRLEREMVEGFEVDEEAVKALLEANKPVAKPAGTGKKKNKNQTQNTQQVNADIWGKR